MAGNKEKVKGKTRVLFIGGTRYSQPLDPTQKKKIKAMAEKMDLTFIGFRRGKGHRHFSQEADFYLAPAGIVNGIRQLYFLVFSFFKGLQLVKKKSIPLVVCQSPFEGIAGALVKKFRPAVQLIVEIHGRWDEAPAAYHRLPGCLERMTTAMGKWSIRRSDALRVISAATRAAVEPWAKHKKIFTFPAYTDIEVFLNTPEQDPLPHRFIFVGQLVRLKGIDTIIDAVSILKGKGVKIEVLLVGEGKHGDRFRGRTRQLGVEEAFKFTGRKEQPEVAGLIKTAAALILPSTTEGFGRVIVEAFACSRPVIGSRVGGIPELIEAGKNGFLVEAGHAEALADRLHFAAQNPREMQKMGKRGRDFVKEKFSTPEFVDNYFNMIKETLAAGDTAIP